MQPLSQLRRWVVALLVSERETCRGRPRKYSRRSPPGDDSSGFPVEHEACRSPPYQRSL
jgi:hypothetical protein